MFGQLDKQRAAEQEVILHARRQVPGFSIVRLGKLAAPSPAESYDQVRLESLRAELEPGDALGGELRPDTAAAVIVQTLMRPEAINSTFSLGPVPSTPVGDFMPSSISDDAYWADQWLKLIGPEVYRRPLTILRAEEAATWLQEWARLFLRPGRQLTTPIAVQNMDDGVLIRFLTTASGYADRDDDSKDGDDPWAAAAKSTGGDPDGALLLVAEAFPTPRIRVTRAEMAEGVLVKEMSEAALLAKLDKDVDNLEAQRRKS